MKADKIFRRRYLVIIVTAAGGIYYIRENAYPLTAVETMAALSERYREIDPFLYFSLEGCRYFLYYYFVCAEYFFPAKYEYNIMNDPVAQFFAAWVGGTIAVTYLIGKIFDLVMQTGGDVQKKKDDGQDNAR
ncbi:uncharacterized protein BKA55DRAFT_580740 [Fusarium redolens]|uniref:Uncharacterized protein n=1 Tax=Fusarium redolens TaxID=48865 RepID=A0A9P9JSX4_FUSRE|nr:uncharacterized protein BKA55DRAFT_580740 [Fusarium redolens]KAH7232151.1 hypothetical protein BKA55DRAFT_580740 [Fusarium redolens]